MYLYLSIYLITALSFINRKLVFIFLSIQCIFAGIRGKIGTDTENYERLINNGYEWSISPLWNVYIDTLNVFPENKIIAFKIISALIFNLILYLWFRSYSINKFALITFLCWMSSYYMMNGIRFGVALIFIVSAVIIQLEEKNKFYSGISFIVGSLIHPAVFLLFPLFLKDTKFIKITFLIALLIIYQSFEYIQELYYLQAFENIAFEIRPIFLLKNLIPILLFEKISTNDKEIFNYPIFYYFTLIILTSFIPELHRYSDAILLIYLINSKPRFNSSIFNSIFIAYLVLGGWAQVLSFSANGDSSGWIPYTTFIE